MTLQILTSRNIGTLSARGQVFLASSILILRLPETRMPSASISSGSVRSSSTSKVTASSPATDVSSVWTLPQTPSPAPRSANSATKVRYGACQCVQAILRPTVSRALISTRGQSSRPVSSRNSSTSSRFLRRKSTRARVLHRILGGSIY